MTRIIRSYIALMAVTLLLFSCAKDEAQGDSQLLPIQLTAAGLGTEGTVTRAANNVNTPTNFFDGTNYINFTVAVDGTNYTYKTNDVNVNMTSTSPAYFPVNGNSVIIKAYYPADKMQYASTAQTFTVEADQSTDANYKASDLMYGLPKSDYTGFDTDGKSVLPTTNAIPLEFVHKMVKITMNVTINGAVVKNITMKNIMRSIDFNPADGTLSNVAAVATTGLDNVIIYDNSTGTSADFTCAAIIPEQNPAAATEFIDVVIQDSPSDKTLTYKLQEDGDFESGKQYVYNLTVNNDEILCTTSITDWDTAVDGANYTHGDGLALLRNVKKLPLWYMARYNIKDYAGTTMATVDEDGYYFNWSYAMSKFAATTSSYDVYTNCGKSYTNGESGVTYHMPVVGEWYSIVPTEFDNNNYNSNNNIWKYDNGSGSGTYKADFITVKYGYNNQTKSGILESSFWVKISNTEVRAIRFLGTEYCSAWKYIYTGNVLTIYATIIDIVDNNETAARSYYTSNWNDINFGDDESEGEVSRTIYPRGITRHGSMASAETEHGSYGYYESATLDPTNSNSYLLLYFSQAVLMIQSRQYTGGYNYGSTVRLFRDN